VAAAHDPVEANRGSLVKAKRTRLHVTESIRHDFENHTTEDQSPQGKAFDLARKGSHPSRTLAREGHAAGYDVDPGYALTEVRRGSAASVPAREQ
jgi:hypothetical protein